MHQQPSRPHPIVTFMPRPQVRPVTLMVAPRPAPPAEMVFPEFDPQTVPPSMSRIRGQFLLLATFGLSLTLSWLLGG